MEDSYFFISLYSKMFSLFKAKKVKPKWKKKAVAPNYILIIWLWKWDQILYWFDLNTYIKFGRKNRMNLS